MKIKKSINALLLLVPMINIVSGVGPIPVIIGIGAAGLTSTFLASYEHLKCRIVECCLAPWFKPNITGLSDILKEKLYGQHLVINAAIKAIKGHVNNKNPKKPLVLSFHGWTGGGKNYVSRHVAEHLYAHGIKSKYVHQFVGPLHFPHESKVETYKDQLREWIKGNVTHCGHQLFIFDEVDSMPGELLDAVAPYLDYYTDINGVDYRKSIFLFLSNLAGNEITKKTFEHWEKGNKREDLSLKEMEELITTRVFNQRGGFWRSTLIEKNLVNAFVPFLPLERSHIKKCIRDDLIMKKFKADDDTISKVADELQFFPEDSQLFSKSGCKRVSEKVDYIMEEV